MAGGQGKDGWWEGQGWLMGGARMADGWGKDD